MWGRNQFYFADNITVGVSSLDRAVDWYCEKLGLRRARVPAEDVDAFLVLSRDDNIGVGLVVLGPNIRPNDLEQHPILYSKNIEATRDNFTSRGITVGDLQRDSGGNQFFQFQDLDGNTIEVCVEP